MKRYWDMNYVVFKLMGGTYCIERKDVIAIADESEIEQDDFMNKHGILGVYEIEDKDMKIKVFDPKLAYGTKASNNKKKSRVFLSIQKENGSFGLLVDELVGFFFFTEFENAKVAYPPLAKNYTEKWADAGFSKIYVLDVDKFFKEEVLDRIRDVEHRNRGRNREYDSIWGSIPMITENRGYVLEI